MSHTHDENDQSSNLGVKFLAGASGGLATIAMQKLLRATWKQVTGEYPPEANDPEASTFAVITWAAASAVGVAITQVMIRKFAVTSYRKLKY